MRIISSKRYRKLRWIELEEEIRFQRGYSKNAPKKLIPYIRWRFENALIEFVNIGEYRKDITLKKGEIGKFMGKTVIIK